MNTATETGSVEADRYLKEVAPHLAALPAEERADLLEDLAQHLREIAAEPGPPLAERLGSPEAYATELLASAGVVAEGGTRRPLVRRATALAEWARRTALGQEVVRLWPALRPAWWVARAYLVVSVFAALTREGSNPGFPLPQLFGSHTLGLLAVAVAIPLSIRLGRRELSGLARIAVAAGNVVLAIYALPLLGHAGEPEVRYVEYGAVSPFERRGCLTAGSGLPITNLYAYDTEGRLLDPVLLYDQDGQPIDNLCPEFDSQGRRLSTEYRQDVNGAPVYNAFPRRQAAFSDPEAPFRAPRPGASAPPASTVPVRPPAVVVPRLTPTTTATTVVQPTG